MAQKRGVWRSLHAAYWDDPTMQKVLTPEQRLVLTCLRTGAEYGLAGVFRYYPAVLMARTGLTAARGWTESSMLDTLDALERAGYVGHDREQQIVFIINGLRWDPFADPKNGKQRKAIVDQLAALPATPLLLAFVERYPDVAEDLPEDLAGRIRDSGLASGNPNANTLSLFRSRKDSGATLTRHKEEEEEKEEEETRVPPPPAAPALSSREQRDQERNREAEALRAELVNRAGRDEDGGDLVAAFYLDETERGLVDYAERRGQLWTPTKRRDLFARLNRPMGRARELPAVAAILGGLELFADKHAGGKDAAYLVGIVRRLAETLTTEPKAFHAEFARHRKRHRDGVHAQAAELLDAQDRRQGGAA